MKYVAFNKETGEFTISDTIVVISEMIGLNRNLTAIKVKESTFQHGDWIVGQGEEIKNKRYGDKKRFVSGK